MADELVLAIVPLGGAFPIRVPVARRITSIGSDPSADVRLVTAPARWAVVQQATDGGVGVDVLIVSSGTKRRLVPGERVAADGLELALESTADARDREKSLEEMVSALAAVDTPERAVELMLTGLIATSGADLGAVILADRESWSVAAARDKQGQALQGARELLSDTIVRDVLESGERLRLDDVAKHSRYAAVPSVTAMSLGAALCLPMRLDGRTLGAVFLARHDRLAVDDKTMAELHVLAAIAVPILAQLRRAPATTPDELIGESAPVRAMRGIVKRIGPTDLSALLHGPSGSGKELVARALHTSSARSSKPMIAINCASVAASLLDAELFGYRKGAFTGAMTDRVGLIEAAHGSTLFLDEIGDMPMAMQAALLRVLEQREVKRLGDNVPRAVDFRLVCATHKDLEAEVAAGRFRADLLFRLREVTIDVPPLADRGDDIVLLAGAFLRAAETQLGLSIHTLTDDAQNALKAHSWPGNVRELKATMRRAAVLADGKLIRAADLGLGGGPIASASPLGPKTEDRRPTTTSDEPLRALIDAAIAPGAAIQPLANLRDEVVKLYVELAVARSDGDRDAAAKALEIGVRSLYRYLA